MLFDCRAYVLDLVLICIWNICALRAVISHRPVIVDLFFNYLLQSVLSPAKDLKSCYTGSPGNRHNASSLLKISASCCRKARTCNCDTQARRAIGTTRQANRKSELRSRPLQTRESVQLMHMRHILIFITCNRFGLLLLNPLNMGLQY